MVIKEPFTTESPIIANYDYNDIINGTGVEEFDLAIVSGATTTNIITPETLIYSTEIETSHYYDTAPTTTVVKCLDEDFDLTEFTTPRDIKGTGLVSFSWHLSSGAAPLSTTYIKIIFTKVSGATETEVGNGRGISVSGGIAGGNYNTTETIPLSLNDTHFAAGDILRVTIQSWTGRADGSAPFPEVNTTIAHDPQNRDGAIIIPSTDTDPITITKNKIWIPFKLNQ